MVGAPSTPGERVDSNRHRQESHRQPPLVTLYKTNGYKTGSRRDERYKIEHIDIELEKMIATNVQPAPSGGTVQNLQL